MSKSSAQFPAHRQPAIRTIAMPADTNPSGDIFGGWLMGQMDLAAANAAVKRARCRITTVAVDRMVFLAPVRMGDEVSMFAEVVRVGRTSMDVEVEAWRSKRGGEQAMVTHARFTCVALDADGRPAPVPPEEAQTAG
ncbi:MAG: acyl-CoA thioesterase [Vulcanimicrobiaceae bacterium]